MRALIKYAPGTGNVNIGDMPEPECSQGRVKIKVQFCGVCGTDLHVLHDTFPNSPPCNTGPRVFRRGERGWSGSNPGRGGRPGDCVPRLRSYLWQV
jgi:hypothetical protein